MLSRSKRRKNFFSWLFVVNLGLGDFLFAIPPYNVSCFYYFTFYITYSVYIHKMSSGTKYCNIYGCSIVPSHTLLYIACHMRRTLHIHMACNKTFLQLIRCLNKETIELLSSPVKVEHSGYFSLHHRMQPCNLATLYLSREIKTKVVEMLKRLDFLQVSAL